MARNKDFSRLPAVRYSRSLFGLDHGVKTSMSVGKLYPLKVVEVLPGDTFKSNMTGVVRCTSAFYKPIIDNLFMDVHAFFVPLRLLFSDSEGVFGNTNPSAYEDNALAEYPKLPVSRIYPGTVGDYLGLPVDVGSTERYVKKGCSVLPFRAFALIYDQWFRNQNAVGEMYVQRGATQSSEYPNNNAWAYNNYTGQLPNVSKKADLFTSCLPGVQKGAPVNVPLSNAVPVFTGDSLSGSYLDKFHHKPLKWLDTDFDNAISSGTYALFSESGQTTMRGLTSSGSQTREEVAPINLYADTTLANIDVSDLRLSFQLQRMLEKDALYGSRYNEFCLAHFGVTSPDSRLQFTEYLGGGRIPIQIQQVSQTSAPSETSPLAAVAGNSQSLGYMRYSKGFTEHGYVITVGCIRQLHTYQQGIPKLFFRHKREDFYDPLLAHISEQPVWKTQLYGYASSSSDSGEMDETPFAYNEAWAEYRSEPSIITGQMRSRVTNSLDVWHLADLYDEAPTFGKSFVEETSQFVDRVLTVPTESQDNFLVDLWFKVKAIRVMPVYSVPGLVDHDTTR